jgi:HD superfamily phosphohydrolase
MYDDEEFPLSQATAHCANPPGYECEIDERNDSCEAMYGNSKRKGKWMQDNIWGITRVRAEAIAMVDTPAFQRMRHLNQLGVADRVFMTANHKRFEHSIGVYHLAEKMMMNIRQQGDVEVEAHDLKMVGLAGLCHDLGHGPFSHLYDNEIIPKLNGGRKVFTHEDMTTKMIDYMVDENNLDMERDEVRKIQDLIMASEEYKGRPAEHAKREKAWMYEIVANPRNGIDVDKFDYLERDSHATGVNGAGKTTLMRLLQFCGVVDNELCYWSKETHSLYDLLAWRAKMHRTVYTHKKVKAVEFMVTDALLACADYLQLNEKKEDPQEYISLTDDILAGVEHANLRFVSEEHVDAIRESQGIISRISNRHLYEFIGEVLVPPPKLKELKKVTSMDIIAHFQSTHGNQNGLLREDELRVKVSSINYGAGESNPIDKVGFFDKFDDKVRRPQTKEDMSRMLPSTFSDTTISVFSTSPNPEAVAAAHLALDDYTRYVVRVGKRNTSEIQADIDSIFAEATKGDASNSGQLQGLCQELALSTYSSSTGMENRGANGNMPPPEALCPAAAAAKRRKVC